MNTITFDMSSEDFDPELIQKVREMGNRVELRGLHCPFEDELMSAFQTFDVKTDPFTI